MILFLKALYSRDVLEFNVTSEAVLGLDGLPRTLNLLNFTPKI